ncbi:MAG: Potassium efflux system KefA protein / Small-conductance mechanosensitive channel [uncultured Chthoniobacterales bacterium]|uniref:Potassium efflux system KefA protein / Small-conductance mechanosensitive channel n=1 Tax=uncultured Chthoniobacterales bacterium TaxID=1836801 RepID=A0A6J4HJT0_9BACT|nr:MAG: Potassium efflux system KefA protein / Small-conductance mechanosensitive channel [uncultured Chthoniobacterales bacterium]
MLQQLQEMPPAYRDAAVVGAELLLVAAVLLVFRFLIGTIFRRLSRSPRAEKHAGLLTTILRNLTALLVLIFGVAVVALAAVNAYAAYRGSGIYAETVATLSRIPPGFFAALGVGLVKALALVVLATVAVRIVRRLLLRLQARVKRGDRMKANDESVEAFFKGLSAIASNAIWLLVLGYTALWLQVPPEIAGYVFLALRIYLIISIGLLVVKAVAAIVDTLDALTTRFASRDNILRFYHDLRSLVPLLRRCLEYAIYVTVAALVMLQTGFIAQFAAWGPMVIQIIGIFFLARVAIEICNLLVDRPSPATAHMSELELQQRATLMPMVKSFLASLVWFGAIVLMLNVIGINPFPLLAGAGIVGIVVGFGAQPVINDVVSGLFILFENIFLVGDYIEVGAARGTVEAIQLRTTRLRDPNGALHIVRNGQLSGIVNFSKSYTFAVVEVGVAYDADLDRVFALLAELGRELNEQHPSVLEPTEVRGVEKLGPSEVIIRTTTRVKPGTHGQVARDFRKRIIEAFKREGIEIPYPHQVSIEKAPA